MLGGGSFTNLRPGSIDALAGGLGYQSFETEKGNIRLLGGTGLWDLRVRGLRVCREGLVEPKKKRERERGTVPAWGNAPALPFEGGYSSEK